MPPEKSPACLRTRKAGVTVEAALTITAALTGEEAGSDE